MRAFGVATYFYYDDYLVPKPLTGSGKQNHLFILAGSPKNEHRLFISLSPRSQHRHTRTSTGLDTSLGCSVIGSLGTSYLLHRNGTYVALHPSRVLRNQVIASY